MNSIFLQKYIEKFESAKTGRGEIENIWEEINEVMYGKQKQKKELQDFTVRRCRNQLASHLQNLIITPLAPWFGISLITDHDSYNKRQEEEWSQDIEEVLLDVFNNPQSNFTSAIRQFFLGLCGYGTAILMIEENDTCPYKVFFRNVDVQECYFEEDMQGLVNVIYRNFKMPVHQAMSSFEEASKSSFYKKIHESDRLEQINVLHVVHPDENKYKSIYIDIDNQTILSEGRFDYFPYFVVRQDKESSVYGYPLAANVLSKAKMLTEFDEMIVESAQNTIRPALAIPNQGYTFPMNFKSGGINTYQNGYADKIYPLSFSNPISLCAEQQKCIDTIQKAFYLDVLHMSDRHEMTAAEVNVRCMEQARILAPICASLEFELLNPMIRGVYLSLKKFGFLPKLQGCDLNKIKVSYKSFVHKSHKANSLAKTQDAIMFLHNTGLLRSNPELLDNIDSDKLIEMLITAGNAPKEIFKSQQEVKKIRASRVETQREQAQRADAQEAQIM